MGKEKSLILPCFYNYRILHKGLVDINGLFAKIPKWFLSFEYDFWEKGLSQKDIGIGKEYQSNWNAEREINDYVKFEISMVFRLINIKPPVEVDGKKLFECEFKLHFDSQMVKNYNKNFGKDKVSEILRQIYERYIRYHDLLDYEDKLAFECVDFVNLVKSHLHN